VVTGRFTIHTSRALHVFAMLSLGHTALALRARGSPPFTRSAPPLPLRSFRVAGSQPLALRHYAHA
jgi:hypothetical protein